jgi:hypothetical protein
MCYDSAHHSPGNAQAQQHATGLGSEQGGCTRQQGCTQQTRTAWHASRRWLLGTQLTRARRALAAAHAHTTQQQQQQQQQTQSSPRGGCSKQFTARESKGRLTPMQMGPRLHQNGTKATQWRAVTTGQSTQRAQGMRYMHAKRGQTGQTLTLCARCRRRPCDGTCRTPQKNQPAHTAHTDTHTHTQGCVATHIHTYIHAHPADHATPSTGHHSTPPPPPPPAAAAAAAAAAAMHTPRS